jgi:tetratricopeptide (TPR) repeat protein
VASKKKRNQADVQKELRELTQGDPAAAEKPPIDMKQTYTRVGLILGVAWMLAIGVWSWSRSLIPIYAMAGLSVLVAGLGVWLVRYVKRSQALGALLRGADTDEGRKEALKKLETDYKKDDAQAVLARAQLEMQEDPRKALATLESVDADKVRTPGLGSQLQAMRAMIHLTLGETGEARTLADKLDLSKQQDAKARAMFATVASEAWARTGEAKKAVETLELFNPEDAEYQELRPQMWRARAFAYAGANDMKGAARSLKKLADMNPHLLGMFVGAKKIHPLLEREAKQLAMKMGAVPRKMVRQRM